MENCCIQGHIITPFSRGGAHDCTTPRLMNNARETIAVATEAVLFLCWVAFHPEDTKLSPPIPTAGAGWTAPPDVIGATFVSRTLTKTTDPESATPMVIRSGKTVQTEYGQQKLLPQHQELPPTPTVTSHQKPYLERATATQIMSSCAKNCP